jgi:hypothetical protein
MPRAPPSPTAGPGRGTRGGSTTPYAAEELLELDDDPEELDESDDEDDEEDVEDVEDDDDFEDAGALLDEEPRLSLR